MVFALADLLFSTILPVCKFRVIFISPLTFQSSENRNVRLADRFLLPNNFLTPVILLEALFGTSRSRNYTRTHC